MLPISFRYCGRDLINQNFRIELSKFSRAKWDGTWDRSRSISSSVFAPNFKMSDVNRPFPSSCLRPFQSESKCEVFVMVISSTLHMNEN